MKTLEQRCRDAGVPSFNTWTTVTNEIQTPLRSHRIAYNAALEQCLPIIEQKDAGIADLYSGKRGACATCEPVGELNQKLAAEIADLKNENAKMRTMFDLDYGESYKAYLAEYEASELTPKEAFIFQMLNHVTVQLNARIKELEKL